MTNTQAAALQTKWQQRVDPPRCEHLHQEMENTENGYLMGHYYCRFCGASVTHP